MKRTFNHTKVAACILAIALLIATFGAWSVLRNDNGERASDSVTGEYIAPQGGAALSLQVKELADQRQPLSGVVGLAPMVSITSSARLKAPVRLTFSLRTAVQDRSLVLVGYRNEGGKEWSYLKPDTVSQDGKTVTVVTDHLSDWWPFEISTETVNAFKELLTTFRKEVADGITGGLTAEAEHPTCNEDQIFLEKDGTFVVDWGKTSVVHRCIGGVVTDKINLTGGTAIKLVNKMRYPVQVAYPITSKVLEGPTGKSDRAKTAAQRGAALNKLVNPGKGYVIIYPGELVTLWVDLKAERSVFNVSFSGSAQSLYQLEFAVKLLLEIRTRFGGKGPAITGFVAGHEGPVAEVLSALLELPECIAAIRKLNVGEIIGDCLSSATVAKYFGPLGVVIAPIMFVGPVINYFKGQLNALGDIARQRDEQRIVVMQPIEPFAGTWESSRFSMHITGRRAGELQWGIPCAGPTEGEFCYGRAKVNYSRRGTALVATYTDVRYYTQDGLPKDAGDAGADAPVPGDAEVFAFEQRYGKNVLKRTPMRQGVKNTDIYFFDPYVCKREHASLKQQRELCGYPN